MTTLVDGWYPNPDDAGSERWWYRNQWTDLTRPRGAGTLAAGAPPPPPIVGGAEVPSNSPTSGAVAAAALVLAGGAVLLELQSVSVVTGAGVLFIGAAVAAMAVAVALLFQGKTWLRVVTVLVLVACVTNAIGAQRTIDQRRDDIRQIFNTP